MTPPPSPEALIQRLRDLAGCARYGGGEWPCRDRKYPLENWCPGCTSAGAADALASSQEALRAAERAREERGVALAPSLANDALAVGMVLDDQRERIDLYERVLYGVRQALGDDGLHAQLMDLPDVVRAALGSSGAETS